MEVRGNNRSVMPLDVLGRTRATLTEPASTSPWPKGLGNLVKLCRAGDRALQLLLFNEECLVSASHQLALITSLPFIRGAERDLGLQLMRVTSYVSYLHGRWGPRALFDLQLHLSNGRSPQTMWRQAPHPGGGLKV